jgi:hypothetical protein
MKPQHLQQNPFHLRFSPLGRNAKEVRQLLQEGTCTTSTHSTKTSTHRQESRWLFLPHSALHLGRVQGPWSRPPCDTLPNFNNGRLTGDEKLESEDHWTLFGRRRRTGDEKLESEAHCALSGRRKTRSASLERAESTGAAHFSRRRPGRRTDAHRPQQEKSNKWQERPPAALL